MSILGTVIRTQPIDLTEVVDRLAVLPGTELALNPGDGRLVVIFEDALTEAGQAVSAAATLAGVALWPQVLGASLVWEYSGPDSPAPPQAAGLDFRAWRSSLSLMAEGDASPSQVA